MTVPWPEGSVAKPPSTQQMLAYLDQLGTWVNDRRRDLDRLDQKVQSTPQGTQDMVMTLTVWQAIKDRYTDLVKTWDSGRVTDVDLKKLAVMTWSNLNDMLTPGTTLVTGGGLAVSLPEACRMLEALIAQLSSRYELAPVPTEVSARIAALMAQVDRIKDQIQLDPPEIRQISQPQAVELSQDVKELVEKTNRGGDIGGVLGPLEVRAARMERDLIVGHAERQMLADKLAQARLRRTALIAREEAVSDLVKKTQASVDPTPKYAVPHVEALGQIPTTGQGLESYLARLDQVSSALDIVQQANEKAYAMPAALIARLERAEGLRLPGDPLATSLASQIRDLLSHPPIRLSVVEPLIAAYEASGRQS